MKGNHNRIKRFCAVIIGIVFLIAGFFKLLDPVGASLVCAQYLKFFHLGFLLPLSKGIAVFLALAETLVGAALFAGIWRRPVAWTATALLSFFTVLTLILAIARPEMDCGCFGEAIHLTPLQSLLKNLLLLLLALAAFLPYRDLGENRRRKYVSFGLVAVAAVAFAIWSLGTIPLVDFTDFRPGTELVAALDDGQRSEADYVSMFVYEKNGQEGAFPLDRLPDSTWTFLRTETFLRNGLDMKERTAALSFRDDAGNYRDEAAVHGNVMAVSVYDTGKVPGEAWTRIASMLESAGERGFTPLLLATSTRAAFDSLQTVLPAAREVLSSCFHTADYKTLISLNRSNGGATWLSDGVLIRKYPRGALPSSETLLEMTGVDPTEEMLHESTRGRLRFQGILFYALAVLLLL